MEETHPDPPEWLTCGRSSFLNIFAIVNNLSLEEQMLEP